AHGAQFNMQTHRLKPVPLQKHSSNVLAQAHSSSSSAFTSERGGPMTRISEHYNVKGAGIAAGIEIPVHPQMTLQEIGFYFAINGQDTRAIQLYLGIKTRLSPFRNP